MKVGLNIAIVGKNLVQNFAIDQDGIIGIRTQPIGKLIYYLQSNVVSFCCLTSSQNVRR